MKKISIGLLVIACTLLMACGRGDKINGHTTKTAFRSVKALKNRLPETSRIEFEVSFWTIRDANKEDAKFLSAVDGKTPLEIISLGKEIYQQRKNEGFADYAKYSSWDDMIAQFGKEREDQDIRKVRKQQEDERDKANDVLYKL